jgi:hypothetical protein
MHNIIVFGPSRSVANPAKNAIPMVDRMEDMRLLKFPEEIHNIALQRGFC